MCSFRASCWYSLDFFVCYDDRSSERNFECIPKVRKDTVSRTPCSYWDVTTQTCGKSEKFV